MTRWLLTLFLALSALGTRATASTFIGNGGNTGDLDLAVTRAEIDEAFKGIESDPSVLCQCNEGVANVELCRVLRALTDEQKRFCQETLVRYQQDIRSLANQESTVKFTWSDEPLSTPVAGHEARPVDAVTRPEAREIIIDRDRFLGLPGSYRLALMTHELFHLVKFKDHYLTDAEAVGPFKEGHELLDTLGAAIAVSANEDGTVNDFRSLHNVSRAYKEFIFNLSFSSIDRPNKAPKQLLIGKTSSGTKFSFAYKPDALAYRLVAEGDSSDSALLSNAKANEDIQLYGVGLGYHWTPIEAYLSRWSEMQVSIFVDALMGSADYHIGDGVVSISDHSSVRGGEVGAQIHFPITLGIWLTGGWSERQLSYQYNKMGVSTKELQQIVSFGGGYAF